MNLLFPHWEKIKPCTKPHMYIWTNEYILWSYIYIYVYIYRKLQNKTDKSFNLFSRKMSINQMPLVIDFASGNIYYNDAIMSDMASQIPGASIVYSTVCSGAGQRKYQSSASLAFVGGIHRSPVNSPHKGPVTRKCFHLKMSSRCGLGK